MPPYLKDLYNGKINGKTLVMPQVTRNLPNAGGSYQSPVVAPQSPGLFIGPQNKITPPAVVVPPAPTPLVGSFGGTAALPQKYDYNSGVVTPAQTGSYTPPANNLSGIPTKFINPKTGAHIGRISRTRGDYNFGIQLQMQHQYQIPASAGS